MTDACQERKENTVAVSSLKGAGMQGTVLYPNYLLPLQRKHVAVRAITGTRSSVDLEPFLKKCIAFALGSPLMYVAMFMQSSDATGISVTSMLRSAV